jgi:hypothetical protein
MANIIAIAITGGLMCALGLGSVFCLSRNVIPVKPYMTEEEVERRRSRYSSSFDEEEPYTDRKFDTEDDLNVARKF